jgi:hypothetical protein
MILCTSAYTIEVFDDRTGYDPRSADNVSSYDRAYPLSDYISSTHGIRVMTETRQIASAVLCAGGGASGVHECSALIHENSLLIAVGPFVVRLSIPSLDLLWSVETDDATCFGVHRISDSSDFISHGELSISRVTEDGQVLWSQSGADIFTGDLTVTPHEVRVADFDSKCYSFDLVTGAPKLLPST